MSESPPTYHIPQGSVKANGRLRANMRKRLEAAYRSQLSAVIETERLMVEMGYLRPEQRRVLSREERRVDAGHVDNKSGLVVE